MRHRQAGQVVVNRQGYIHAASNQQLVRRGEAGIAFNNLQLVVAQIAFEFDIAQAAKIDAAEKFQTHFGDFRIPGRDVIRALAVVFGKAPHDFLGVMKQRIPFGVDVGVITSQKTIRPWDEFRHDRHQLLVQRLPQAHVQLLGIVHEEQFFLIERLLKQMRMLRLDDHREHEIGIDVAKIGLGFHGNEARRGQAERVGQIHGLALVEQRQVQLGIGFVENVVLLQLLAKIGQEFDAIIVAGKENAAVQRRAFWTQHQFSPKLADTFLVCNGKQFFGILGVARAVLIEHGKINCDAPAAQAARDRQGIR